jgi:3-phenylpropionate/cinnamic acid dioxygenase small subunit
VPGESSIADSGTLYVNDPLYERLVSLASRWKEPSPPPSKDVEMACERLIIREARLLDDREFEKWLALFGRECIYWIPAVPTNDPRREIALEFHDRRRLEDRVARLLTPVAYSQIPPTRTCHLLSNLEVFSMGPGEVAARANFVIQTYRAGVHRALAGWCGYLFADEAGERRIALKQINLIDCDEGQENNSFFL